MRPIRDVRDRFWSKVNVLGVDECWVFTGRINSFGYGHFYKDGKLRKAHRVSWELSFGDIPNGMLVCHKCDNPSCVNPSHLFLGTPSDNMQDMIKKGRQVIPDRRGEKGNKAKLTNAKVGEIRLMLDSGNISHREIADIYGVTKGAITAISTHRSWIGIGELR